MDFGTIKQKIKDHKYKTIQEFFEDMELTFGNCDRYNGTQSDVGGMGQQVLEEYHKQIELLNMNFYV